MSMVFATETLLANIGQDVAGETRPFPDFARLTASLHRELLAASRADTLAYIETEYWGGAGSQRALLYSNGQIVLGPLALETSWDAEKQDYLTTGEKAISPVLARLGVAKGSAHDEFAALNLEVYRSMDE